MVVPWDADLRQSLDGLARHERECLACHGQPFHTRPRACCLFLLDETIQAQRILGGLSLALANQRAALAASVGTSYTL